MKKKDAKTALSHAILLAEANQERYVRAEQKLLELSSGSILKRIAFGPKTALAFFSQTWRAFDIKLLGPDPRMDKEENSQ